MRRYVFRSCLVLLALASVAPTAAEPGLQGTWVLVQQTYGKGQSNLATPEAPIRLSVTNAVDGVTVWIWQGSDPSSGAPWPAMMAEGRALRAITRSAEIGASSRVLEGRCEIVPVDGEDLVLDVRERYALSADGQWLEGTVEVRFTGGDRNRGGYTLHRRFARES